MNKILVWARHKEPAVVVGAVYTAAVAAHEVVVGHPGASWHGLFPLIVAAVIRQFVTPAP